MDKKISDNTDRLNSFIKIGYSDSKGAPGNPGSMLNEIISIQSATDYLNNSFEYNYDTALALNIESLRDSKLGEENDGIKSAGRVKVAAAKFVATEYGISVGLAAKSIIATKSAESKYNRVMERIVKKNNMKNFETIPLFGDVDGLKLQIDIINGTRGEVKIGNTIISKEDAIKIVNESGKGGNPSDTAIFIHNNDNGNLHMTFYSDKDCTGAIIAQSTLNAEITLKREELNKLVQSGILSMEESTYYSSQMESASNLFSELENSLSDIVSGPGKHLSTQCIDELIEIAKTSSKGANPDKYWKAAVVSKFTSPQNPAYKKVQKLLLSDTNVPPTDNEMMETYIRYINLKENQGSLITIDQRMVIDLSNLSNGPRYASEIGEIRTKTVEVDLKLIRRLDNKVIKIDGMEVGLGTYLEAVNVFNKLHLNMLFGGDGVYSDPDAFSQENGGVTVDRDSLSRCLPFKTKYESFVNFEVGDDVPQIKRRGKTVTGSTKIVYAIKDDGSRFAICEKKQRSKSGDLGKLNTVYNYHRDLQKCLDSNKRGIL